METREPKALLKAALDYIELHPEEWNQSTWRCWTGMCLAGHLAALHPDVKWERPDAPMDSFVVTPEGQSIGVGEWAKGFLGLDRHSANALFSGYNNLNELRAGIDAYINDESVIDAIYDAQDGR